MQRPNEHSSITRRDFFWQAAAPLAVSALAQPLFANATTAQISKMGIASTSFAGAFGPAPGEGRPGGGGQGGQGGARQGMTALEFLEKCHSYGAGGIQTNLSGDVQKLRARADVVGDVCRRDARHSAQRRYECVGERLGKCQGRWRHTVVRTAMLGGRRYETHFPNWRIGKNGWTTVTTRCGWRCRLSRNTKSPSRSKITKTGRSKIF
ncbi:MAG: hypothetical protein U0Y68_07940 [Blastocatellia bacterium]